MSCLKREVAMPSAQGAAGLDYNALEAMQPRAPAPTPREAKNGGRVKHANVPPEGVYLPNNNRLAPHMRSPEYVQMSTAAAITLGIMPGKMHRLRLHALPEPAADLSGRLPRQLRLLRARPASRGGPRLCRPQLHPRRLAGGADGRDRRQGRARR